MHYGSSFVDISAFFSRYHLPKLRSIHLYGRRISPWGLLKSQTTTLTALRLTTDELFHGPGSYVIDGGAPTIRVQLRRLERFYLTGDCHRVFTLLNLWEIPDKMDSQEVVLRRCSPVHLSQTFGSCLGERVQRRGKIPGGGIALLAEYSHSTFCLHTGDILIGGDPAKVVWFAEMSATTKTRLEDEEADRLYFDLIAHIQRDQVTILQTNLPILRWEDLCVEMRNLTYLHLVDTDLSTWFAELGAPGSRTFKELLPGLEHIEVTRPALSGDWSPLTNFLPHRAAIGNRISSLRIWDHPHMGEDVAESIERTVDVFEGSDS